MNDIRSFQRVAAVATVLSAPMAWGNIVVSLIAINYNFEAFSDPVLLLTTATGSAGILRWALIADMLGYYLLLAPAALLLWRWLEQKSPNFARLYTVSGLTYILVGAIGAGILAAVWPPLMAAYSQAAGGQREAVTVVFSAFSNAVYGGLWNLLETIPGGLWWLGIGWLLMRERRILGIVTVVLGAVTLLDAVGSLLGVDAIASIGLFIYLFLAPLWALWLGIDLLRKPVQIETT